MYRINLTKAKALAMLSLASLLNLLPSSLIESSLAKESKNIHREELPGRRIGGGTRRENCIKSEKSLTALIPENNLGVTTAAYPTFLFYIPEFETSHVVEFVLRDEKDNQVYEKNIPLPASEGIVNLSLPKSGSLPPLAMNKNYRWYLSIICDPQNRSKDIVVEGWIQRIEITPTLANKLENATLSKRVELYLEAGIWHDAMTTLAQLRRTSPTNSVVVAHWTRLLHSVGLEAIASEPLAELELAHRQN